MYITTFKFGSNNLFMKQKVNFIEDRCLILVGIHFTKHRLNTI
jgi:hypothetical protein